MPLITIKSSNTLQYNTKLSQSVKMWQIHYKHTKKVISTYISHEKDYNNHLQIWTNRKSSAVQRIKIIKNIPLSVIVRPIVRDITKIFY